MKKEEFEVIQKRAKAATPGSWYVDDLGDVCSKVPNIDTGFFTFEVIAYDILTEMDAKFIAHAREDIPKLLAEVEQLQQEKEKYMNDIVSYRKWLNKNLKEKRKMKKHIETLTKERDEYISILSKIRDTLLPMVDEHNECGDMSSCVISNIDCFECLVKRISHQLKDKQEKMDLLQKQIVYLKNELKNCGYRHTDLDNDFLWENQDKQFLQEE